MVPPLRMKSSFLGLTLLATAVALVGVAACGKDTRPAADEPSQTAAAAAPMGAVEAEEPTPTAASRFEEESFILELRPKGSYTAGQPGQVEVVLSAKGAFKCNDKYPYKLALEESPGVKYPSRVLRQDAMTLKDKEAVLPVDLVPETSGAKTIAGRFSFSVCTDDRCLVERRDLTVGIDVK